MRAKSDARYSSRRVVDRRRRRVSIFDSYCRLESPIINQESKPLPPSALVPHVLDAENVGVVAALAVEVIDNAVVCDGAQGGERLALTTDFPLGQGEGERIEI